MSSDEGRFLGIDLAWNSNARTGLAVLNSKGALVNSTSVRTDNEIDTWLHDVVGHVQIAAVDAPLVVPNDSGMRACERMVGEAFGRFDAACYPSHRGMTYMNPPRGEVLAGRQGWSIDPSSGDRPQCIEVYPHAAMVGLFGLGRTLKYKRGPVDQRRQAMMAVLRHIESIDSLAAGSNVRWRAITEQVGRASRPIELDSVEDEIDAVLCAHLAWLWAQSPDTLHVYGDVVSGYIVAPPPPVHKPDRGRARASRDQGSGVSTLRVSASVHEHLKTLAEMRGESIEAVLGRAVEALRAEDR